VVEPIQRGVSALVRPIGDFFSSVGELGNLRERNRDLEARIEDMETHIEEAESVAEENETLRRELDLNESWATMDRVAAEVISRPSSNYRWYLEIDRGRADGIRPDMAVINIQGLVGKIVAARDTTATVLLIVDPTGAASAKTNDGEVTGIVEGNGAGQPLSMELVESDANINEGEIIRTASYNSGIFPPNIPIGYVTHVTSNSASATQDVQVEPYIDFTSIEFVQVLLESGPKLQPSAPGRNRAEGE
jgi:rod shape-determining protein MreC